MTDRSLKEGNVPTDEVLLHVLRSELPVVTRARRAAADRIEEYCRDAAVAEEAMLRCFMATGKTVDDVPTEDTIDAMAAHVIRCLSETPKWRLASDKPTRGGHVLAYDAARQFIFIVTEHFDWWGHIDPQGRKEYDAPRFTHWMPLPEAPKATCAPDCPPADCKRGC